MKRACCFVLPVERKDRYLHRDDNRADKKYRVHPLIQTGVSTNNKKNRF